MKINRRISIAATIFISIVTVLISTAQIVSAAGTASLTLTPSSGSFTVGNTVNVAIYEDSGSDSVNAVQADFTYPSSLLSFTGATNSSAFTTEAQSTGSGGVVKIARGTCASCGSVTGSQLVATVHFTATAAGTASLSFAGSSEVDRSTDNGSESLSYNNASYSLVAAPVTPPPSGGGGTTNPPKTITPPKTSTTPKSTPTPGSHTVAQAPPSPVETPPGTVGDTAPPVTSDIQVSNLSLKSATISWHTSEPATSEVIYGFTDKYGLSEVDSKLTQDHKMALSPKYLLSHSQYHFAVRSTDAAGNQTVSKDQTFNTELAKTKKSSSGFWTAFAVIFIIAAPPASDTGSSADTHKPDTTTFGPASTNVVTPSGPAEKPPQTPPKK
jgi:hypothetical protein